MNNLNRKVKSTITTTLNTHNNKVSVANTFLYCNACGKSIQKNPLLCYIFIDYFCSEKCHVQKHKTNLERINDIN